MLEYMYKLSIGRSLYFLILNILRSIIVFDFTKSSLKIYKKNIEQVLLHV